MRTHIQRKTFADKSRLVWGPVHAIRQLVIDQLESGKRNFICDGEGPSTRRSRKLLGMARFKFKPDELKNETEHGTLLNYAEIELSSALGRDKTSAKKESRHSALLELFCTKNNAQARENDREFVFQIRWLLLKHRLKQAFFVPNRDFMYFYQLGFVFLYGTPLTGPDTTSWTDEEVRERFARSGLSLVSGDSVAMLLLARET